jgi:hypothetical protein
LHQPLLIHGKRALCTRPEDAVHRDIHARIIQPLLSLTDIISPVTPAQNVIRSSHEKSIAFSFSSECEFTAKKASKEHQFFMRY